MVLEVLLSALSDVSFLRSMSILVLGDRVNPTFRPSFQGNPSNVIFTQCFRGCFHVRCKDVFVEDENACKTVCTVHLR